MGKSLTLGVTAPIVGIGTAGILAAASASGEDLAKVSDIITDGLSAFGLEANKANHFADVLSTTATNAKA